MPTDRPVCELFDAIVSYADAIGIRNINELPGCWEHEVDDKMFVAVNGHKEYMQPVRGPELGPYSAYVEVNGWPAAVANPYGGVVMGGSEADLIERFRVATTELSNDDK